MSSDHRLPSERSFGLSVGGALVAVGALLVWRRHVTAAEVAGGIGIVLVLAGLAAPSLLRGPNRIWSRFAQGLGWINSRVLLTVFFFVVLTPVGFLLRLFGWNPFRPAARATSWTSYPARQADPAHYDHQF